jgi:hypothetical protein
VRDARVHHGGHTAARTLLLQGIDEQIFMAVMGWSDGRTLRRYQLGMTSPWPSSLSSALVSRIRRACAALTGGSGGRYRPVRA